MFGGGGGGGGSEDSEDCDWFSMSESRSSLYLKLFLIKSLFCKCVILIMKTCRQEMI